LAIARLSGLAELTTRKRFSGPPPAQADDVAASVAHAENTAALAIDRKERPLALDQGPAKRGSREVNGSSVGSA